MSKHCALYRLTLTLITSLSLCLWVHGAAANPFHVSGVPVDVTAANAVEARQQAMNKAQIQAWDTMITALVEKGEDALRYIETPDSLSVGAMVETMQVRNEQTAPTQYRADFDITFSENAVRSHLARSGIGLTLARTPDPVLVVPWYRDIRGQMHIWGDGNLWLPIWAAKAGRTDPPVRVPLGDIMDMNDFKAKNPKSVPYLQEAALLERYNLSESIMVLAIQETPMRIAVSLIKHGREIARDQVSTQDPNQDESILLHQAMTRALVMLRDKNQPSFVADAQDGVDPLAPDLNASDVAPVTRTYDVVARFRDLREWIEMKRRIERALGAENVAIKALGAGRVELSVTGPDLFDDLRQSLTPVGLALNSSYDVNAPLSLSFQ